MQISKKAIEIESKTNKIIYRRVCIRIDKHGEMNYCTHNKTVRYFTMFREISE